MQCQRCNDLWDNQAVVRIRTEIMDLAVCDQCAKEASDLGLVYQPLAQSRARETGRFATAA